MNDSIKLTEDEVTKEEEVQAADRKRREALNALHAFMHGSPAFGQKTDDGSHAD